MNDREAAEYARPTFGSLCSGIGGMDLGLDRSGMRIKWQVELDPFRQHILAKHWPDVPRFGDIRGVGRHNLSPVDLICAGFPCQPFSNAGKQRGDKDDRYLWPEVLRVIAELRPAWVLLENVPGIIKLALDTVLSDLEAAGYEAAPLVIPACAVGAPHRRDRVWIVAYADSYRRRPDNGRGVVYDADRDSAGRIWQAQQQPGIAANTGSTRRQEQNQPKPVATKYHSTEFASRLAADDNEAWQLQQEGRITEIGGWAGDDSWWSHQPGVCGVVYGVPCAMDRIAGLGDTVVPEVVEMIGEAILVADRCDAGR